MQVSDDLFLGPVSIPAMSDPANPSPMSRGVGPLGRVYVFDIVPAAASASNLAASQAVATAKNLTLFAGTGITVSTDLSGNTRYNLDVARVVGVVSNNIGDTTQLVTVSGFDLYGVPMTARVTLNGTTLVNTLKAFKSVTSVAISAATAGNVSCGSGDRLGLPYRVTEAGYVISVKWGGLLPQDAGVFVAASQAAATLLTGDVRGLYVPSSTIDGTKRLVLTMALTGLAVGPQATRLGAAGVDQV